MQQLPQIKAAYDWFFSHWQQEASRAVASGNTSLLNSLDEKRDTLERGVFVLMFGQFELAINSTFLAARTARSANHDWTHRRGWDANSLKGKKVPFETKLSLLMDKNSSFYGKILQTYDTRNHCAHGGTTEPVGSIDALEADLYTWQGALRS